MRKTSTDKIRCLLSEISQKPHLTVRQLASLTGICKTSVSEYLKRLEHSRKTAAEVLDCPDSGLEMIFGKQSRRETGFTEPCWKNVFAYLKEPTPLGHPSQMRHAWFYTYVREFFKESVTDDGSVRSPLPDGCMSLSTFTRRWREERHNYVTPCNNRGKYSSMDTAPGTMEIDLMGNTCIIPYLGV